MKSKIFVLTLAMAMIFSFGISTNRAAAFEDEGVLACSPSLQTVEMGEEVSFSVEALIGSDDRYYIWYAEGGTPEDAEGQKLEEFATVYDEAGEYTVYVFSMVFGNDPASCEVVVEEAEVICEEGTHKVENECVPNEEEEDTATVIAAKIVCPTEDLLPNWGNGGDDITADTASDFLATHETCYATDWAFEWAPNGTANPGDNEGEQGGAWTLFWDATATEIPAGAKLWVREIWNDEYIPFSSDTTHPRDNVSAEFYCSTDVLNYDNYDWINPVEAGETYYCIGFNVAVEGEVENIPPVADAGADQGITLPTASVTLDGSLSSDSDGSIVSYVWEFVSGPSNVNPDDVMGPNASGLVAGTYVWKLTVTDDDGATDEDSVEVTVNPENVPAPECSDDVDNTDAEDILVDEADPGCHTDGNPNNSGSYVPTDDDETDQQKKSYVCSDGEDNDDDHLIDYPADKGCSNPEDNDEKNDGGVSGGGRARRSGGQVLGAQTGLCNWTVDTYMRRGYRNDTEQVKTLQEFLNWYMNVGLEVDGIYGIKTEAAVKAFQVMRAERVLNPWNLSGPTGIFYKTTLVEAKNLMCPQTLLPIPTDLVNWSQNPYQTPAPIL